MLLGASNNNKARRLDQEEILLTDGENPSARVDAPASGAESRSNPGEVHVPNNDTPTHGTGLC